MSSASTPSRRRRWGASATRRTSPRPPRSSPRPRRAGSPARRSTSRATCADAAVFRGPSTARSLTGRALLMTPTQDKEPREPDLSHRSPFVPHGRLPDPFTLVLFGATGDLAARKLFPAVFALARGRFLPDRFAVVGIGRRAKDDPAFRADVRQSVEKAHPDAPADEVDGFLAHVFYHRADFTTAQGLAGLRPRLGELEAAHGLPGNRLFYLATDPEFFVPLVAALADHGLTCAAENCWARVVIEKPFGRDLTSALELDRRVLEYLRPEQVYRIDHYLGKDTVQ